MALITYYCAASLDGFIAEADDSIDWLTGYEGRYEGEDAESAAGAYERFYERIGALVSGSATYEWLLGHMSRGGDWPYREKPCWVLSSRDLPVPDGEDVDVRVVRGAVSELHAEMAASAEGGDLWIVGGGNVASQFADAGLLDEVIVTMVPVVLGAGKPLFERRLARPMTLNGAVVRDSGMVELRYAL